MRNRLVGFAAACLSALIAATVVTPATQAVESDESRFFAGVPYTGDFPSPQIMRDHGRFYAFATTEDGLNLPAMHSDGLRTWVPRSPLPDYARYRPWSGFNDAMPEPGSWAVTHLVGGVRRYSVWAPAVARMGGRYVVAYAAVVRFEPWRMCIGLGYADSPEGKFTDPHERYVVCSSDPRGSIDPDLIRVGKKNYLIWKNAGVKGSTPTTIWSRRLNAAATAFTPGSRAHRLLSTGQAWEGNVIEAPDMVRFQGRYYLFYAGNTYTTSRYATGYAICGSVHVPCVRPGSRPLLTSNSSVVGPGGAAPFVDLDGRLRLAYHAWSRSEVGNDATPGVTGADPPRRLHIAALSVGSTGRLAVRSLG